MRILVIIVSPWLVNLALLPEPYSLENIRIGNRNFYHGPINILPPRLGSISGVNPYALFRNCGDYC